jgi:hypothetical protein
VRHEEQAHGVPVACHARCHYLARLVSY